MSRWGGVGPPPVAFRWGPPSYRSSKPGGYKGDAVFLLLLLLFFAPFFFLSPPFASGHCPMATVTFPKMYAQFLDFVPINGGACLALLFFKASPFLRKL